MKKREVNVWGTAVCVCAIVAWMCVGCAGVQGQAPDDQTIEAVFEGAGEALALVALDGQKDTLIERVRAAAAAGVAALDGEHPDVGGVIAQISLFIDSYELPDDIERYRPLATTAANMMANLVKVDMSVTENQQKAIRCVTAFLSGVVRAAERVQG